MNDRMPPEDMSNATNTCVRQLRGLVQLHIGQNLAWYKTHTDSPRLWFRVSGVLLIVLSICLPVLSSISASIWQSSVPLWVPSKELLVSSIALAIALLSGLGTFFHWSETWHANMRAKLELQHLVAMWEVRMVEAQNLETPKDQTEAAIKVTKELFEAAAKVDATNTEGYFKNVQFPESKKP